MFRSFIYLDEDKFYSYLRQIDKRFADRPSEINKKKSIGANIGVKSVGANAGAEIEEKRELNNDLENDYDVFEKALDSRKNDDYFDFVDNDNNDLNTVPKRSIIRVEGKIEIPEQFDTISVAQNFMPYISSQIQTSGDDEREIMAAYLDKASADIPIIVEKEDIKIVGNLCSVFLRESYPQLQEYSEQEVILLCKVICLTNKPQVEIFDPLRDFIKLPRSLRRSNGTSENSDFESIYIEGPVLKVEIIGIYK
ncbi:MAG: hypothetical protein J5625_00460 [Lachnospiraceae bacterium]|nr:hypothetical protein [Lachnospiraceae bacterium]